ncbi:hypothetical protein MKZ38_008689 [Zalerion maritima]|uniref:Nephrocystin 3-like N-terminal domain-containing protein n=1 Tax=Zalerion maritima TaxID=339359 RepID=A0AAD5RGV0_9PEZI|nr:hypothetical protein MKZ38_008689 [Zalerion maritima]
MDPSKMKRDIRPGRPHQLGPDGHPAGLSLVYEPEEGQSPYADIEVYEEKRLQMARVWTFGYSSNVFKFHRKSVADLATFARDLLYQLRDWVDGIIVEKDSSVPFSPGQDVVPVNTDHRGLARFPNTKDPELRKLLSRLVRCIDEFGPWSGNVFRMTPEEKLNRITEFLGLPNDSDQHIASISALMASGTCDWVTSNDCYESLLEDISLQPRLLWYHGLPGSGKSSYARKKNSPSQEKYLSEAMGSATIRFNDLWRSDVERESNKWTWEDRELFKTSVDLGDEEANPPSDPGSFVWSLGPNSAAHEQLPSTCLHALLEILIRDGESVPFDSFAAYASSSWYFHPSHINHDFQKECSSLLGEFLTGRGIVAWIRVLAETGQLQIMPLVASALLTLRYFSPVKLGVLFKKSLELWAIELVQLVSRFGRELRRRPSSIHDVVPAFCPYSSLLRRQARPQARPSTVIIRRISEESWSDILARLPAPRNAGGTTCTARAGTVFDSVSTRDAHCDLEPGLQSDVEPPSRVVKVDWAGVPEHATLVRADGSTWIWDLGHGLIRRVTDISTFDVRGSHGKPVILLGDGEGKLVIQTITGHRLASVSVSDGLLTDMTICPNGSKTCLLLEGECVVWAPTVLYLVGLNIVNPLGIPYQLLTQCSENIVASRSRQDIDLLAIGCRTRTYSTAHSGGEIRVYDANCKQQLSISPEFATSILRMGWSSDETHLAVIGVSGTVTVLCIKTCAEVVAQFRVEISGIVNQILISQNNSMLLLISTARVTVWSIEDGRLLAKRQCHDRPASLVHAWQHWANHPRYPDHLVALSTKCLQVFRKNEPTQQPEVFNEKMSNYKIDMIYISADSSQIFLQVSHKEDPKQVAMFQIESCDLVGEATSATALNVVQFSQKMWLHGVWSLGLTQSGPQQSGQTFREPNFVYIDSQGSVCYYAP